jgi:transcriptional regulator with XRE-family HTH domain
MMVSLCPARVVAVMPELRQPVIEFLHRGFLLLQKIGDEGLLAVLQQLFIGEQFLDVVGFLFVGHRAILVDLTRCNPEHSQYPNQRIILDVETMNTFGTIISAARRAEGLSQKDLAAKIKKEDGQVISAQYLNDIEHDRRNPPSEFLIVQFAAVLKLDKDVLILAAGMIPQDLQKLAAAQPQKMEEAFKAFRKAMKKP